MPNTARIAIYALTGDGLSTARRLAHVLGGRVYAADRLAAVDAASFESLPALVADTFSRYDGHVFVTAAGIAVRCIAPQLVSKAVDPAVVVLDQQGRFAVSLLSGHLGGANDLAEQCAEAVGGQAVITTATDTAGIVSLDMLAREKGLTIGNLDRIKTANGALLAGERVQLYDPDNCSGLVGDDRFVSVDGEGAWRRGSPGVWVSCREDCPDEAALRLYPNILVLGVGCRRGVAEADITAHIHNVLEAASLSPKSVAALGSVDVKSDEPGLLAAARSLDVEPVFIDRERLDRIDAPNPSGTVMRRMGIGSVSEAAALLLAEGGELVVEKTKTKNVTLAVARRSIC